MSKFLLSPLLIGSAILSAVLAVSTAALATEKVKN